MAKPAQKNGLDALKSTAIKIFFSCFYSFFALLDVGYRWVTKGNIIFEAKAHPKPNCLEEWKHATVELKEMTMHYVEDGDKSNPLMVFVHGFPEFWYSYKQQLVHFKNDYHVMALDLRGSGDSSRPTDINKYGIIDLAKDVAEFIEKSGHKKAVVVGHDWGAIVSWELVAVRPDLVDRLVIMNVPHPLAFQKQIDGSLKQFFMSWYMFLFQMPFLPEMLLYLEDYGGLIAMYRDKRLGLVNQENFTEEDVAAWKYTFSKPNSFTGPLNIYRTYFRGINYPQHEDWTVKHKTLIIWGENDGALAVEGALDSVNYCQDVVLKLVPNSCHFVHQDTPEIVNKYIEQFLNDDPSLKTDA